MAERSDVIFDSGLTLFGEVIDRVAADDWDRPSACEGWTALDVLGHLGSSINMGISVLEGRQPTWPDVSRPADNVDGEPGAYWEAISARARGALVGADLDLEMDTPMGRSTVATRLAFPAIDLYVHAWDIGHPLGIDVEIPQHVIDFTHHYIDPFPADKVRGEGGAFAAEVEAPADATPTERFMAWTGRPPR